MEVERKFLVKDDRWRHFVFSKERIEQGVLKKCKDYHVKIRISEIRSVVTKELVKSGMIIIKSNDLTIERYDTVTKIPIELAGELLSEIQVIEKKWRYTIANEFDVKDNIDVIYVDEFIDSDRKTIVELEYYDDEIFPDTKFPDWFGEEVTGKSEHYSITYK